MRFSKLYTWNLLMTAKVLLIINRSLFIFLVDMDYLAPSILAMKGRQCLAVTQNE